MRKINKNVIIKRKRTHKWHKIEKICVRTYGNSQVDYRILLSIYMIESFFRPLPIRIVEYVFAFCGSLRCLLTSKQVKNYTIGPCQIGLATILNYYGIVNYRHKKKIRIDSVKQIWLVFSAISTKVSLRILENSLTPICKRAKEIFSEDVDNQLYYIGEQYNGRYSYGLMLSEVYSWIGTGD